MISTSPRVHDARRAVWSPQRATWSARHAARSVRHATRGSERACAVPLGHHNSAHRSAPLRTTETPLRTPQRTAPHTEAHRSSPRKHRSARCESTAPHTTETPLCTLRKHRSATVAEKCIPLRKEAHWGHPHPIPHQTKSGHCPNIVGASEQHRTMSALRQTISEDSWTHPNGIGLCPSYVGQCPKIVGHVQKSSDCIGTRPNIVGRTRTTSARVHYGMAYNSVYSYSDQIKMWGRTLRPWSQLARAGGPRSTVTSHG